LTARFVQALYVGALGFMMSAMILIFGALWLLTQVQSLAGHEPSVIHIVLEDDDDEEEGEG
jgi:hypothetical protein